MCRRELVSTDTSQIGWGGCDQGQVGQRLLATPWSGMHINTLFLRAVLLALQSFLPHLKGIHVLVRTDNTTVVAYINHQGGLRSHRLLLMAQELLLWAQGCLASMRSTHTWLPECGSGYALEGVPATLELEPISPGCAAPVGQV